MLNINDFHGRIDPANDLTTKWATTIEQQRIDRPDGTVAARRRRPDRRIAVQLRRAADQPTIDVMNELCLNASSVGNHEFDKGYSDLDRPGHQRAGRAAPDACPPIGSGSTARRAPTRRWAYLGANVYTKGTQTPALPEYTTFTVKASPWA